MTNTRVPVIWRLSQERLKGPGYFNGEGYVINGRVYPKSEFSILSDVETQAIQVIKSVAEMSPGD